MYIEYIYIYLVIFIIIIIIILILLINLVITIINTSTLYIRVYMHIHIYVYIHVCMYVCMYVYVHGDSQKPSTLPVSEGSRQNGVSREPPYRYFYIYVLFSHWAGGSSGQRDTFFLWSLHKIVKLATTWDCPRIIWSASNAGYFFFNFLSSSRIVSELWIGNSGYYFTLIKLHFDFRAWGWSEEALSREMIIRLYVFHSSKVRRYTVTRADFSIDRFFFFFYFFSPSFFYQRVFPNWYYLL